MPNQVDGVYFTPCPVPSCPAYEPNSIDGEYAQPFRHIQYKRTPSLRPIATLAMLLCRRIVCEGRSGTFYGCNTHKETASFSRTGTNRALVF